MPTTAHPTTIPVVHLELDDVAIDNGLLEDFNVEVACSGCDTDLRIAAGEIRTTSTTADHGGGWHNLEVRGTVRCNICDALTGVVVADADCDGPQ